MLGSLDAALMRDDAIDKQAVHVLSSHPGGEQKYGDIRINVVQVRAWPVRCFERHPPRERYRVIGDMSSITSRSRENETPSNNTRKRQGEKNAISGGGPAESF